MADDVAAYLAAQGLGTVGKNIFSNNFPDTTIDAFLITDTGGSAPEQYYPLDHPTVQVAYYGRAASHNASFDKIMQAYHLLNRKQNITIGTKDAMFAAAIATPQVVGLDHERKRWLMTFNVQFKIRGVDGY